ncbi:Quinidine resistance 3 [Lecanosticta acicola]|uniref:Quinidine resistance 3 n=1 Tax=Lecanosticta acicola TaxID=111012 RepID=A0AAI8Z0F0_9PEZI|nr:Quinidine resistance 3 [Lecanosticta acicola]
MDDEKRHPTESVEEPEPELKPASIKSHEEDTESEPQAREKRAPGLTEIELESQRSGLHHVRSHVSTHDAAIITTEPDPHYETGDEIYDRFTSRHKMLIVAIMSFCSFLAPISSTSILAASPEVVKTYNTTGAIFNISNALYMLFMGLSPLFWGPLGQTYGRKWPLSWAAVTFTCFSIGSALAPNLASYFVFRMLTAFQGTAFLIVGGTVIGDIYKPVERGTAYGWFMSGTLIGPAMGPFIGGIIVTFVSWRNIFWLQTALSGLASLLVIFLLPETIHHRRSTELQNLSRPQQAAKLWTWINPARIVILFRYPNLIVIGLASSSLVWNMYSLLTPIRYVLNPRFGLTTPLQSGLFYIAPGCGYLFGTFFGGRWADRTVKTFITRRSGQRIPEDRLRSCLTAMGIVIPACMLIYGWSIEKAVGGIPLPVIAMFVQGVAQLFCFPSLNTYCLDVMQARSSEVVAGNYFMRYLFGAAGSAAVLPIVEAIGVGWFSTISALFVAAGAAGTWLVTVYGRSWREAIDKGKKSNDGD